MCPISACMIGEESPRKRKLRSELLRLVRENGSQNYMYYYRGVLGMGFLFIYFLSGGVSLSNSYPSWPPFFCFFWIMVSRRRTIAAL